LHDDTWLLAFSSGLLSGELARSFPNVERFNGKFVATSLDKLGKLLRRAAALAQSLPNQAAVDYEKQVNKALAELPKNGTEIERMVRQRVGQNTFRNAMMDYWGSACAVTGITVSEVLRASHAKPWADCVNDAERLDVFNGFLLSANLDALFDRFLITFNDDGTMHVSSKLTMDQRISLGLNSAFSLRWVAKEHKHYLQYHRTIFIEGF
jgi:predicted restriction endonuclease